MNRLALVFLSLLLLVAACTDNSASRPEEVTAEPGPRPTTNPLFSAEPEEGQPLGNTPTPPADDDAAAPAAPAEGEAAESAAAGSAATVIPSPTRPLTPTPTVAPRRFITRTVFDDTLNENWHLENSHWMTVTRQADTTYRGRAALQFIPREDFGTIFFSVDEDAEIEYPRPQVAGLQFWLSGGEDPIDPQDLAVTIVGSNEYAYWVPGDYSVQSTMQPVFSETRLEFLGLRHDVPPGEWVQIEVRLNELQYDPPYRYVTGFYLKNDRGVFHPFYIDDITLIMVEAGDE